ncbi:uncharacterized protein LOC108437767 [Pygocentrus nattereri]|uniref:Ig-like domain-containing protein n=2 Tax=Pygocentrus nattereri TaxID=42514 RepID=A0A3B4EI72_PYGNA|nr:uncharacterized protein LOC108437767 [Pygocentrus nattereri]
MASSVFQIISSLAVLLWVSFICGKTQEPVLDCIPSLRVPRNTVWKSPEKETLKINCTVTTESHCWKNLSVSWCKIEDTDHCRPLNHSNHTGTGWRNITEKERKFFLIFWSLSLQDAGLYRCKSDGPVFTTSHGINVTVTASDTDVEVVSNENKTTNGSLIVPSDLQWLPYAYICSGIVGLVLTVLVVALLVIRCQGPKQSKKEKVADHQSSTSQRPPFTSTVHDSVTRGNTHSLPTQLNPPSPCIYDNAPIRASSQRDGPSRRHLANHTAKPGHSHDCFNMEVEEEENPLVYASLNHKALSRGQVRISHPEETSEYSAIRLS